MLAKPCLVIAAAVEPLDKFEIALQRQRRIDTRLVEWCEKNAEAQSLAHGDSPPLDGGGSASMPEKGKLHLAVGLSQSGGSDMCDSAFTTSDRGRRRSAISSTSATWHGQAGGRSVGRREPGDLRSAGDGGVASQLRSVRLMHWRSN